MRQKFITKNWTLAGLFGLLFWIFIISVIIATYENNNWWFLSVVPLAGCYMAIVILVNTYRLKERRRLFEKLLTKHPEYQKLTQKGENAHWYRLHLGALDELHNVRDAKMMNVIGTQEWTYGEFTYNLYGRLKNYEYVRAHVYYGVMSTALPRALPHVFFDSIKARRRQFRFHFAKDQRHSLEGDFDKHFVTYFPDGYTIDSMSFISPDVMLALRDARDYDIEIFGNRLFLYGPLFDPEKQLQDMSQKITGIKKELLDNILTYRDHRLPFAEGRKSVAQQGASLKISKFWTVVSILGTIGYILLRIAAEVWGD